MLRGFTARSSWAAAFIALGLGPVIGMCYVNRGKLAVSYLMLVVIVLVAPFLVASYGILDTHPLDAINVAFVILLIIGAIHCFLTAKRRNRSERIKWYARWYVLLSFVVLPLLFSIGFRHFFYEPFLISANSMSPNINMGDYLFAKKSAYHERPPERGDIIIFKIDNVSFIKRIVGLPGDRIQIRGGMLYINDQALPRKQVNDYRLEDSNGECIVQQFVETLPEGKEYSILDRDINSPLDNTEVYSVPARHYFVLGDNRDQSQDSRDQNKIGFVPEENIIGRASVILWNETKNRLNLREMN